MTDDTQPSTLSVTVDVSRDEAEDILDRDLEYVDEYPDDLSETDRELLQDVLVNAAIIGTDESKVSSNGDSTGTDASPGSDTRPDVASKDDAAQIMQRLDRVEALIDAYGPSMINAGFYATASFELQKGAYDNAYLEEAVNTALDETPDDFVPNRPVEMMVAVPGSSGDPVFIDDDGGSAPTRMTELLESLKKRAEDDPNLERHLEAIADAYPRHREQLAEYAPDSEDTGGTNSDTAAAEQEAPDGDGDGIDDVW